LESVLLDHVEDHIKRSWLENDGIRMTVSMQMLHDLVKKSAWWCSITTKRPKKNPNSLN